VRGERFGERLAALHGLEHVAHDALHLGSLGELGEDRQAPIERQTGCEERGSSRA
jgi:hypothetical protein